MSGILLAGLTRVQISQVTGIPRQRLYNQLDGNKKLDYEVVAKIENILKTKNKGIMDLLKEIEKLIVELQELREAYIQSVEDDKKTDQVEFNKIQGIADSLCHNVRAVVEEIKNYKDKEMEL